MLEMTADEIANEISERHVEYFKQHPDGEVRQTIMIEKECGCVEILACAWGSEEERLMIIHGLKHYMAEEKAVRYTLWTEIWMKKIESDLKSKEMKDFEANYTHGDIAQNPDDEAVLTTVVEPGNKLTVRIQRIKRDADKKVIELILEDSEADYSKFSGPMTKLLPEVTIN